MLISLALKFKIGIICLKNIQKIVNLFHVITYVLKCRFLEMSNNLLQDLITKFRKIVCQLQFIFPFCWTKVRNAYFSNNLASNYLRVKQKSWWNHFLLIIWFIYHSLVFFILNHYPTVLFSNDFTQIGNNR